MKVSWKEPNEFANDNDMRRILEYQNETSKEHEKYPEVNLVPSGMNYFTFSRLAFETYYAIREYLYPLFIGDQKRVPMILVTISELKKKNPFVLESKDEDIKQALYDLSKEGFILLNETEDGFEIILKDPRVPVQHKCNEMGIPTPWEEYLQEVAKNLYF